ncbi:MAG: arginine--tRNA ligase [Alphaproteobacteria bacterium 13_2_20CM_2_64_7]|nr:MAG: arginine--tRNA ligase [Alphaproteobacteria bacterium 13_2_20CM_2_64_7]
MSDQNIFAAVLDKVRAATNALAADGMLPAGIDQSRIVVEPPRESAHGDMATNAAMVLAKDAGSKPRPLAEAIAAKLRGDELVAKAEVAGPGFINLTLKPAAWIDALRAVLATGANYGRSDIGQGTAVDVEYVSANPTGPLHVGHCRGAVFGDALANLLAFSGFEVTREYYINDAGAQVDALARSAFLRYREALGEDIGAIPEGLYPGDYLKPVGAELATRYGASLKDKPETEWLPLVRDRAIDMMMADIRNDLRSLNVVHDVFFSERSLIEGPRDQVGETIAALRRAGYVYEGRLAPPKGAPVEDWEDREQTLFRATDFGDDVDRPLMKSDGSYTYFASDIAYHKNKVDRGFASMIDVWGADHGGYVKRVQAAVKAVRAVTQAPSAELDIKIVQLVKLLRGGEPVKMSKRAGEFVTLREVADEVGKDPVRFMMLYRKNDAALDFDLARVIEQSRDNPVFYVQYGHARGQSILRNAREVVADLPSEQAAARAFLLAGALLERLEDSGELALMRRLALYPRLIEAAAIAHEPHRIAFYLYDLASDFHAQWNRGNDASYLRFIIQNDPQMTMARLALVEGVVTVLASGLRLLGVEAPEEMR